jgi:YjbE family integral membrane protein
MDWFSIEFLTALAAVVTIDLVLAGDNAIVIAMAARNVRKDLQKRAMIWGAGAAMVVRTVMTVAVVWLLGIPGLLFAGGALLVWIAYKLIAPANEKGLHASGDDSIKASSSFWGAIRTIVLADVVMGVDNVLGVAGAAHGNFALVVIGLLISVPILIWGSSLLLKYVERFPVITYVGAAVLAFTAVGMMTAEPYLKDLLAVNALAVPLLYLSVVGGVLWVGFVKNHRKMELQISARISDFAARTGRVIGSHIAQGGYHMKKILVPIDGSRTPNRVVPHVIREYQSNPGLEIHLLNVQPRFSAHIARFVRRQDLDQFRQAQAEQSLCPVRKALDGFKVPYTLHVEVGDKGELIASKAQELGCDHIVMSTARKNSLVRMLEDSVTNKVLELTTVPVEVIAGAPASGIERYGIPAALASVLGLALLAAAG